MIRVRPGPPCTLVIAALCVVGTYLPGAHALGIGGNLDALLSPLTWLRLVTWPFVHADTQHLLSNLMLFFLLSPGLEERLGAAEYLFCLLLTAVIIGVAQLVFGRGDTVLIGASGWVFMMILLTTVTAGEARTVSVPTLIVAVLYGWQEIRAAFSSDGISHFAHLLGGACGFGFGLLRNGWQPAGAGVAPPAAR